MMAAKGRKAKSTVAKVLAGTRADRVNSSEPRPARAEPARPDYLDRYGEEAWDRIVPKLLALGVLTELDGEALALYCVTHSRWRMAVEEIRESGVTATTGLGSPKTNPAVAVASQCERLLAAILVEFGLTPVSRSRVKTDAAPQDALADFLSRRK